MQPVVDPAKCVEGFGRWTGSIWKHDDDLGRYETIIRRCRPGVVVETGTNTGSSARWFAAQPGVRRVVTVDVVAKTPPWQGDPKLHGIVPLIGDSTRSEMENAIRLIVQGEGLPTMVSLDADHGRKSVLREVLNYAPLVSPGQYLVIEDGVLAWLPHETQRQHGVLDRYEGTVLEAIEQAHNYLRDEGFIRDTVIEATTPCTMNPFGWWRRER